MLYLNMLLADFSNSVLTLFLKISTFLHCVFAYTYFLK